MSVHQRKLSEYTRSPLSCSAMMAAKLDWVLDQGEEKFVK